MAHSRLEKIGTIYTRVTGLIKAGAMKVEDRPMWYELYQKYPPEVEPRFDRAAPNTMSIRKVFYPEDSIRAKFHKLVKAELPAWDLTSSKETVTQKMIALCLKFEKESGLAPDEAFKKALDTIREQGLLVKSSKEQQKLKQQPDQMNQEIESAKPTEESSAPSVNIKDIFSS